MSTYKHKADFISRTREILNEFEANTDYEKTFFLNCCIGLLIIPQQWANSDRHIKLNGNVDYLNWGIDTSKITSNDPLGDISIKNIARHMRNSLSHFRFEMEGTKIIERIHIKDQDSNGTPTFDLILDFADFRKFILKYAEELEQLLKRLV